MRRCYVVPILSLEYDKQLGKALSAYNKIIIIIIIIIIITITIIIPYLTLTMQKVKKSLAFSATHLFTEK